MKSNKIVAYIILMVLLVNIANAEKYFVLDVNYIIGSVTFNSISLREIDRTVKHTDNSGFLIKAVSFDNKDIQRIFYNMSDNKNYIIYIPYNENAARIEVYNLKNSKIMDIDVSSYADTCGNKACEEHESYESCTKDCSSGSRDDFCDGISDGICDHDCSIKTDVDCGEKANELNQTSTATTRQKQEVREFAEEPEEKLNYLFWILAVLIIIIFVLTFLFIKKKKEKQIVSSLKQYISENIRKGFTLQQIKDVLYREGYSEKEVDRAVKSI